MLINGIKIDPDRTYTPQEAADALGVKVQTLAGYRCKGNVGPTYIKIGRQIRYRGSDLVSFIEASVRPSTVVKVEAAA